MLSTNVPEKINILLVEDDELDVEMIKRLFARHSIKNPIHHASCGLDALETLRGENGTALSVPYIMLVDINMPKMGGLDFLQEIRKDETLKESIAFILTTSAHEADIALAYKLNVAGYFLKENVHELMNMLLSYCQINKFPSQ